MVNLPPTSFKQKDRIVQSDILPGGLRSAEIGMNVVQYSERITSQNFVVPNGETLYVLFEIRSKFDMRIPIIVGNFRIAAQVVGGNPGTSVMINSGWEIEGPISMPIWVTGIFGRPEETANDAGTSFLTNFRNQTGASQTIFYNADFVYIQPVEGGGVNYFINQAVGFY